MRAPRPDGFISGPQGRSAKLGSQRFALGGPQARRGVELKASRQTAAAESVAAHPRSLASGHTCWRRLRAWQDTGLWDRIHRTCWIGLTWPARSTGRGLRWIPPPSPQKGGRHHRPEPDRSRQAGHQAPHRGGSGWPAPRLHPDRGQSPRQHGPERCRRRCPSGSPAARSTPHRDRPNFTPTKAMTSAAADVTCAPGASHLALPGAASKAASTSANTGGWSSGPSPGSTSSGV